MMSNRLLRAAMLVCLSSGLGCTASAGGDDADSLGENALELVCTDQAFAVVKQGNENRFGLDLLSDAQPARAVALNPAIPVNQVCNQVQNDVRNRGLSAECNTRCADAVKVVTASGVRGFQGEDAARLRAMNDLVDDLNAILGNGAGAGDQGGDEGDDEEDEDNGGAVQCNAKELQVIVQGKEQRFGFDNRQVALNPAIPMQNICNALRDECRTTCDAARNAAIATGIKGVSGDLDLANLRRMGKLADDFNAQNGIDSDFENAFDAPADEGGDDEDDGAQAACKARRTLEVIVQGKEQRFGFDGRQVALNPAIPMQNICNDFGQDQACRAACDAARERGIATGVKGISGDLNRDNLRRMGELADAFNRANGNSSNFAANAIFK